MAQTKYLEDLPVDFIGVKVVENNNINNIMLINDGTSSSDIECSLSLADGNYMIPNYDCTLIFFNKF